MRFLFTLAVLFLVFFAHSHALSSSRFQQVKERAELMDELSIEGPNDNYFFQTPLDHFDRQNTDTFRHRFFVNTTYWDSSQSDAPVFLCVGGEGPPLDPSVLYDSDHCNDMVELAQSLDSGALLVALEHRYYGLSIPDRDLSTENLRYLTTEQALEDVALFITHINQKYEGQGHKWITWGGSYPGMVSAFSRLRFPHLIHGSVSSSSPVQAKINMEGYNDLVANSISLESVGGSQECLDTVANGHKQIGDLLQTSEGREQLSDLFDICGGADSIVSKRDQSVFAGDGVIYIPTQSNDPASTEPLSNIEKICNFLVDETNGNSDMERLAALSKIQNAGRCVDTSFQNVLDFYSNPRNPSRSWLYSTCTEYGFYQTCDEGSSCPYTQGLHTIDQDLEICKEAFGLEPTNVAKNILMTNQEFGGWNMQGSRIIFINGEVDPWRALGVSEPNNDEQGTFYALGASHHAWTHPSKDTDQQSVNEARDYIWNTVTAWLKEE